MVALMWPPRRARGGAFQQCARTLRQRERAAARVLVAEQAVRVRDSKDMTQPHFAVGREEWSRFVGFLAEA